jgi:hypothetical protein
VIVWFALEIFRVGFAALPPVPAGFVDAEPPQVPPDAVMVNVVVTGVIPAVVLTVNVVVTSSPVMVVIVFAGFPAGTGVNDAEAPLGNDEVARTDVQLVPFPEKPTVTE